MDRKAHVSDPRIEHLKNLGSRIASDVYFGPDVYVEEWFAPLLTIESGVVVSQGATILLHDSSMNNVSGDDILLGEVILRADCYLGANCTVLCGVEVGAGALIGACSLVLRDVPPHSVAYGSPARVVGTVDEMKDSYRHRPPSVARSVFVGARPWRARSHEENAELQDRIDLEMRRLVDDR